MVMLMAVEPGFAGLALLDGMERPGEIADSRTSRLPVSDLRGRSNPTTRRNCPPGHGRVDAGSCGTVQ